MKRAISINVNGVVQQQEVEPRRFRGFARRRLGRGHGIGAVSKHQFWKTSCA